MHLGIIPDGNRRAAAAAGMPLLGHSARLRQRLTAAIQALTSDASRSQWPALRRVTCLSAYVLSYDNLRKRADDTVMMVREALQELLQMLQEDARQLGDPRIRFIGRVRELPDDMRQAAARIERLTARGTFPVFLALAYDPVQDATAPPPDRPAQPPIDLVVRTGGEMRSSGFFPMQTLYAEWWYTPTLFPAFTPEELCAALDGFAARCRRFGQ